MAKKTTVKRTSTLSAKKSGRSNASENTSRKSGVQKGDLKSLARLMGGIDICMMTTVSSNGMIVSRPMSNNGDVKYNGTSYFFTWAEAGVALELKANKNVNLGFETDDKTYISVAGKVRLVKDIEEMKNHWNPDLDKWFPDGLETEGILMIEVNAKRIKYWNKEDVVEVRV